MLLFQSNYSNHVSQAPNAVQASSPLEQSVMLVVGLQKLPTSISVGSYAIHGTKSSATKDATWKDVLDNAIIKELLFEFSIPKGETH
eukprot:665586-Amphidinium_carterae.1